MKVFTALKVVLSTAAMAALLGGCSTTKLTNSTQIRGDFLKETKHPTKIINEKTTMEMGPSSVSVRINRDYQDDAEWHYQLIQRNHYTKKIKVLTPPGVVFLPFSFVCLPIGILMLEPMNCFGTENVYRSHYIDTPLPGKIDIEKKTSNRSEQLFVADRQIDIYVGSTQIKSGKTDAEGKFYYSLGEVVIATKPPPELLVENEGLEVRAVSAGLRTSYRHSTRSIPESYFVQAYEERRSVLQDSNKARHDNCMMVSNSKREFFECFFQRSQGG